MKRTVTNRTKSTPAHRRAFGGEPLTVADLEPPPKDRVGGHLPSGVHETMPVRCLCERATMLVDARDVTAGRTGNCGSVRCRALAERHPELVVEAVHLSKRAGNYHQVNSRARAQGES